MPNKRQLKVVHLKGISGNFCCFITADFCPLLPELVTYVVSKCREAVREADWEGASHAGKRQRWREEDSIGLSN